MQKSRIRIISAMLATVGLLAVANDPGVKPVPRPVISPASLQTAPPLVDVAAQPRSQVGIPTSGSLAELGWKNRD